MAIQCLKSKQLASQRKRGGLAVISQAWCTSCWVAVLTKWCNSILGKKNPKELARVMTNDKKNWMTKRHAGTWQCKTMHTSRLTSLNKRWRPRPQNGAIRLKHQTQLPWPWKHFYVPPPNNLQRAAGACNCCAPCPFFSGWRCVLPDFFKVCKTTYTYNFVILLPFTVTFILNDHFNPAASVRLLEQKQQWSNLASHLQQQVSGRHLTFLSL